MQEAVIGTVQVLLLVVGLVELIKSLGLEGRAVIVAAFAVALVLGGMAYALQEEIVPAMAAVWFRIVAGALWVGVQGLAAAGLVRFGVSRAERLVAQYAMFSLRHLDDDLEPYVPVPDWAREEGLPEGTVAIDWADPPDGMGPEDRPSDP